MSEHKVVFFTKCRPGGSGLAKSLPASQGKDDGRDEGRDEGGDDDRDEAEYGPHNVKPGHHIAFEAGAFQGAGKVASTGGDGAVVSDHTGREHRIHWHEVKGHFEKDTGGDKGVEDDATAANGGGDDRRGEPGRGLKARQ